MIQFMTLFLMLFANKNADTIRVYINRVGSERVVVKNSTNVQAVNLIH